MKMEPKSMTMPINIFSKIPLALRNKNHLIWMDKVQVQRNDRENKDTVHLKNVKILITRDE